MLGSLLCPALGNRDQQADPPAHQSSTALGPLLGCWGRPPASRVRVLPTPAPNLECSPRDPQLRLEMHRPQEPVCMRAKSLQSCPTLCDPMDHSPPGSSVHGILQVRILQGVAVPSSRGTSRPRDRTRISCVAGRFFSTELLGKHPPPGVYLNLF